MTRTSCKTGAMRSRAPLAMLAISAILWLCLSPRLPAEEKGTLVAGVARTDITPTEPVTLSGYASRKDLSRGVHDPLSARAIAFERDGRRLVLVSTDLIGFYGGTCEPLRQAILEACGLEAPELLLAAIHTHSAPSLARDAEKGHPNNVAYTKGLEAKLAGLVRTALERAAPVRLAAGLGSSPVGVNRREAVRDDSGESRIVLGRNPDAVTDREVQVLKVTPAASDAPAAVLFAYATHSTSLGPKNYLVSGDVHGLAEQFLETYLARDTVAAAFAGASGDIDPWCRVLPEFRTTNGWIPEPVLLGTLLGEEVATVLERARDVPVDGPIRSQLRTLALPGKASGDPSGSPEVEPVPFQVTVARLGDIAFVGLGGEVFNEIGKDIKSASPYSPTFVITHCNGAAGYLAPERCYPEGGYEIQSTPFAPSAADMVLAEVARMLREL